MTTNGAEGKYTFGPFLLDVASRVLSRSGQPVALAPKTFDLLLLLVENQGRVLTKSQMMAELWQEVHVEEANLSFQISTLRKALGEEGAAWIETAPKVGYRFSGPVQRSAVAQSEPVSPRRPRHLLWFLAASAVVILAITGWLARDRETPTAALEPVPLTSYEGIERDPSFSPDGSQVAFVWNGEKQDNFDIYVKAVGSSTPQQLTKDPSEDCNPAWSPDGRNIAFQRAGQGIYLIPPTGGVERKLLSQSSACAQLSWSHDGKHLSFSRPASGGEPAGIFLIAVESGVVRRLTAAEESVTPGIAALASNMHRAAAFSPDGGSLAFVSCNANPGNACNIMVLELDAELKARGPARLIASRSEGVYTIAWTQDGRGLVFATGARSNSRTWKVSVHPGATPEFLSFAGVGSITPAISRTGNRMTFSRMTGDRGDIWRLETDGALTRSPLSSTFGDGGPQFSPDGRKIAFGSRRSGRNEIWVGNADGTGELKLTDSRHWSGSPQWSPDGRWIAYDTQAEDGRSDVYVVDAAGGPPVAVVRHPANDDIPSFSRDGKWVYFYSARDARSEVYRVPVTGGDPDRVTDNGGAVALESFDGKSIYYSKASVMCGVPLFVRSLGGGPERRVLDSVCSRGFQVTERGIYYLDRSEPDGTLTVRLLDPNSGKSREVRKAKTPLYGGGHRLAVSPDGNTIFVTGSSQRDGSDLYLVENFR